MWKKTKRKKQSGSILILALWTLTFLSVFAVHIGINIRQRAGLLSRIENRSKLERIAESGIKKAIALLRHDLRQNKRVYTAYGKQYRHHNNDKFKDIEVGEGSFNVRYPFYYGFSMQFDDRYGIVDEDSKININLAQPIVMKRLFEEVLDLGEDEAKRMTEAIIDWRSFGESAPTGFYSDEYYQNLEFPYFPKDAYFEVLDEIKLVEGITEEVYAKIEPFITIYGDGLVNINTATPNVLLALGLDPVVVNKVLTVRRSFDGQEATLDDYIFRRPFDVASEMQNSIQLDPPELKQLDALNAGGMIKTNSFFFKIRSQAQLDLKKGSFEIVCIYNVVENRVEYWREK